MKIMLYTGAAVPGGLLGHIETLSAGLVAAGHSVLAVVPPTPGADRTARRCADAGAEVARMTVEGKTDLKGIAGMRSLVSREGPDVLHVHLSSPVEAVPAILAASAGGARRIVTTEHAPTYFPLRKSYSAKLKRETSRLLSAVIALSEADGAFLREEFGVPAGLLRVVPNGVIGFDAGSGDRAAARKSLGIAPSGSYVAGYAGALEEKKGLEDLIAAASAVAESQPGLAVVLAGSGSMEKGLRARATDLPFPLIFAGQREDMAAFYAALDVFVLPSHQEAAPLSLLEAMSAGLPVVATRVGGVPEVIADGESGLLVAARDWPALAAALVRLAREPEAARGFGEQARRVFRERYTAERMVGRIEAVYSE